ncbi:MAG TPA: helix-turn-helix transcriptional regulator [Caulobacteraceae bacterium]|nr:helix-turn-helix transcriptional regulator [Caulobacteraceae bacterium]
MAARNALLEAPPYAVETALEKLGQRLRTARLRRNLTIAEVGRKIGAGERAIADAEKGKPSTSIATYAGLLWAFNLLRDLDAVADPARDTEGLTRASHRGRERARQRRELGNEF